MRKRCSRCRELKEPGEFAWHRKAKGQLDSYCRPCRAQYKQEHYAANKGRYIAKAAQRRIRLVEENVTNLLAFLAVHPCADCGETDPLVLEFDHIGDKAFTIGSAIRDRPWRSIEREIRECEVVCSNCHRRRTAQRGGWARFVALASDRTKASPSATL